MEKDKDNGTVKVRTGVRGKTMMTEFIGAALDFLAKA